MAVSSDSRPASTLALQLASIRNVSAALIDEVLDQAVAITQVPAPTFNESERSEFVAGLMREGDWGEVVSDDLGDVVLRVPGSRGDRALMVAAHLDTVFPAGTTLTARREGSRIMAPGIGDNAFGVACALAIPRVLGQLGLTPAVDLFITGNVGEEGLGDLRGMRRVMDDRPQIGAVIAVEGHNLGRVTHVAVGSHRIRVTVTGPGGHSWGDFGNANAIQAAAEIIHELGRVSLPSNPKTTYSVGTIFGGISVNTIAPQAVFDVDLRSIEEFALRRLIERTKRVLAVQRPGISVQVDVIGDRPAGFVSPESPLVHLAVEVLDRLGVQPAGDASSTDANVPISRGIPAVCIGLTSGGNVHREDEFIEIGPAATGLTQLVALTLAAAEALGGDGLHG